VGIEATSRHVGRRDGRPGRKAKLDLEDESAQLLEVDIRVRVQPLRSHVALLHRRPPLLPPAHLVPHHVTDPSVANETRPAVASST
jgi:hypothetical protein